MKCKLIISFLVTALTALPTLCKEEVLFDFGDEKKKESTQEESKKENSVDKKEDKSKKVKKNKAASTKPAQNQSGNLPDYYVNRDLKQITKHESGAALPSNAKQNMENVAIGDTFDAIINHYILALNDEKTPVLAVITSGKLKGYRALGEATLNDLNESVSIQFKALSRSGQNYTMTASALNGQGQTYFKGRYYSNETGLFAGTFLASFVAAYFEGSVPKNTNYFGQIQQDTSVDSAVKKGMAGASIETANMFRDKLKKAKSFIEIKSPIVIKILINDTIIEK